MLEARRSPRSVLAPCVPSVVTRPTGRASVSTTAARSEKKSRARHQNPENRPRSHPTPTLRVRDYTDLALDGLPASFISDTLEFSHTVRHTEDGPTDRLTREGHNLRYAAIVA